MTAHNEAKKEEIAKIVIMAGDPMRAKYIADTYLKEVKLVNQIRGMYAYTGYYNDTLLTIMGHGMGMPSIGIYAYELYHFYDVETIIRVGSCGSYKENLSLMDVVLVESSYTESNFAYTFSNEEIHIEQASKEIIEAIELTAQENNILYQKGTILTSDVFDPYIDWKTMYDRVIKKADVIGAEMESFALFHIARKEGKKAACLLTVVDSLYDKHKLSAEERQDSLNTMLQLALLTTKKL